MQDSCVGTHMAVCFDSFLPLLTFGISPQAIPPHLPSHCPSPISPQQTPVCSDPLPVSTCSHFSTPACEWEHVVFDFLFLCQFAENDGFQIHPCSCKGHEFIIFYCYVVFHGEYVPHFLCPVYHWWAFGLVPGLCYCKQCHNEHTCACVFIIEWFIILWVYTSHETAMSMEFLFLDPWGITTLSSTMVELIYTLTNIVKVFLFLHIFSSICCLQIFKWSPF